MFRRRLQHGQIALGHHAAITDKDDTPKAKTPGQVLDDFLDRRAVTRVARPHVMCDRPTRHHHHAHHHLHVPRLAVATVTVLGQRRRTMAFKIRTGQVVHHQVRVELEQRPQPLIERHFHGVLVQPQMIQRAIPTLQLPQVDLDAALLLPTGYVPATMPVAHVIGLQPRGQTVLAGRPHQAVGDQHQDAADPVVGGVFARPQLGPTPTSIEPLPEAQLVEEVARDEHRSPGTGVEDFDGSLGAELLGQGLRPFLAGEKAIEQRQDGFEGVASPEVGDDLLLDLAVLAHRADDADILVDGAVGGRNFDGADEHDVIINKSTGPSTGYSMKCGQNS